MQLIKLLLTLAFLIMIVGLLVSFVNALKEKKFLAAVLIIFVPFYVFYYIIKLPENNLKKYLAISCIGSFWVFFFLGILEIIFTPPV